MHARRPRARIAAIHATGRSGDEHRDQPSHVRTTTCWAARTAEYERLRAQARVWEAATGRLLDQVTLAPGARCLDAGCGPGETMRLMAQRVGPAGHVTASTRRAARRPGPGHAARRRPPPVRVRARRPRAPTDRSRRARSISSTRGCCFSTSPTPSPCCAASGTGSRPAATSSSRTTTSAASPSCPRWTRWTSSSAWRSAPSRGAGRDVHVGAPPPAAVRRRRPRRTPTHRRRRPVEPLATASAMLAAATAASSPSRPLGLTTEQRAARWLDEFAADATAPGDHAALWPLLIGAWKRKSASRDSHRREPRRARVDLGRWRHPPQPTAVAPRLDSNQRPAD